MKKNKLFMIIFVFVMFFCVNIDGVLATDGEYNFKVCVFPGGNCNGDEYKAQCIMNVIGGKMSSFRCTETGNFSEDAGSRIDYGSGNTTKHYKVSVSNGAVKFPGNYDAYELGNVTAKFDAEKGYTITSLELKKGDPSKCNNSTIACADNWSKKCSDMYSESNWEQECPDHPEGETYEKFIKHCQLKGPNTQDFKDYCEGKGKYVDGGLKNKDVVQSIIDAAGKWGQEDYGVSADGNTSCKALLGTDNVKLISDILLFISVLGVVLVIVFEVTDFIKAIASSDDDALAQAFKRLKNRIISIIVLLLLPVLVDFALGFINDNLHYEIIKSDGTIGEDVSIKVGKASDCGQ